MIEQVMPWVAAAMTLIGFITVWIRIGINSGRNDQMIKGMEQQIQKNENSIDMLEKQIISIDRNMVGFMSEIKVELRNIKETLNELKRRKEE
jgi:peptidoglycan hydrolase CwlO-like protein